MNWKHKHELICNELKNRFVWKVNEFYWMVEYNIECLMEFEIVMESFNEKKHGLWMHLNGWRLWLKIC